jgi:hypothetical protein
MKLLFLATLCAAVFDQSQAHFFGKAHPHESLTVSMRTSTEIPIPTKVTTITRIATQPAVTVTEDQYHTVVETQVVPVTRTSPPITFTQVRTATETATAISTLVAYQTRTAVATTTQHETAHIQPTVSVYELGAHDQVAPVPYDAVLKKRVVMDVLVGRTYLEGNATFNEADKLFHSGATSHYSLALLGAGTLAVAIMI